MRHIGNHVSRVIGVLHGKYSMRLWVWYAMWWYIGSVDSRVNDVLVNKYGIKTIDLVNLYKGIVTDFLWSAYGCAVFTNSK